MIENKIINKIKKWAVVKPTQKAVVCGKECLNYRELDTMSDALAARINSYKISDNTQKPVIIIAKRSVKIVVAILATLKSANYYIPVELPFPNERIENILEQFSDQDYIIITDDRKNEFLKKTDQSKVIYINGECLTDREDFQDIQYSYPEDSLVYMIFTSGTSGKPKGVLIQYSNLENLIEKFLGRLYSDAYNVLNVGVVASFSFDASVKQMYGALFYGNTLVIAKKEDKMFVKKFNVFVKNNMIDVIDGTPSLYKMYMNQSSKKEWNIKRFVIGGEQLEWNMVNNFYDFVENQPEIVNVYGPTECCVDASFFVINGKNQTYKNENVPIGKPINNAMFHIHTDDGRIAQVGEKGELYISGALVGKGYYQSDKDSFYQDENYGWTYKTGDIAFLRKDNNYEIVGRKDNQVKILGNRLELSEVKKCICDIIHSDDVEIMFDSENNKIYAFILKKEVVIDNSVIYEELKKKLPRYGVPSSIKWVDEIPLNKNGKVDIKKLYSDSNEK